MSISKNDHVLWGIMNWILIMNLLIYVGSVLDIAGACTFTTVDGEFWCVRWAPGVRRRPPLPPPPSERLMKVRMGHKNYSFECCGVNELGTVPLHLTEKNEERNGGAKHTLQIHLPRKILYIISSPEICQINSMNRTSKIGTISKKTERVFSNNFCH